MTEPLIINVSFYLIQAITFGLLTFLLSHYYRGYKRIYVKYWTFSLAFLTIVQCIIALQGLMSGQLATSYIHLALEAFKQIAQYLHLSFLVLGFYNAVKKHRLPVKVITAIVGVNILFGVCITLGYGFEQEAVYNRFYLRESLSAFIFGCMLLGVGVFLLTQRYLHFSSKIMISYSLFMGLRYILFSFSSILSITQPWFSYLSQLFIIIDSGGNAVLGFGMLLWMQGAERNKVSSALSKAKYLGKHDALTGVLNREQVIEKIPLAMELSQNNQQQLAILLLDIKRFKFVNETYGLKVGDDVLEQIASRLMDSILCPHVVGRLSGNSFVFVVEVNGSIQIQRAIEHLHNLISRTYNVAQDALNLQCCLGYCIYPQDAESAEELLKNANLALFHAQEKGQPTVQYLPSMKAKGKDLLSMEQSILSALTNNEFILYFQPQLNLISNRLEGVEALIRWQHPEKGILPPCDFLPYVEVLGMNSDIDKYVLDKACQTIAIWYQQYKRRISIAVNITAVEFQKPTFIADIQSLLQKYQIPPTTLELEITENVVITEVDRVMETIVTLQNMGIKVSIDDFGTGYSSLAYLRKLPIDKIKIDRSFITEVAVNDSDLTIVKSMIKLSQGLGKRVLAEGVETVEQLNLLRKLNCDAVQGFFISKPLSEKHIKKYLIRK